MAVIFTNSVHAAIQVTSVSNVAYDYAEFGYDTGSGPQYYSPYGQTNSNALSNATAAVSHVYFGQPNSPQLRPYPYMRSDASGQNATDGSTYVYVNGFASSYSDPTSIYGTYVYSYAYGRSELDFTLTEPSTAKLSLYAYAYTDDPGANGYTQAQGFAQLYDYSTGAVYDLVATSTNGSPFKEFSTTIPLSLNAGDYRLALSSAYSYGISYNPVRYPGGSDNAKSAHGIATLYDIQPIASSVSTAPELTSAAAWLGLTVAAAIWTRCGNRTHKWTTQRAPTA
jgi:hypothetical protein